MVERRERQTSLEPGNARLRTEAILVSVLLATGLFILPGLIYWVGIVVLGPYGETTALGVGHFYADFFGDLAEGSLPAWGLALGPLVLVSLVRLVFVGFHRSNETAAAHDAPAARTVPHTTNMAKSPGSRIEPRISE